MEKDGFDPYMTVEELKNLVVHYRNKNQLDTLDDVELLIKSIVVESSELLDTITSKYDQNYLAGLEDELADIIIYCIALAHHKRLSITTIVENKIQKNKERGRVYPKKEMIK